MMKIVFEILQYFCYTTKMNTKTLYSLHVCVDRRLEILGTRRAVHQRHRLARRQSHAAPRSAGKVQLKSNVFGRGSLYNSRSSRPDNRKM